ncbi:MAG: glycosyltransferase family 2 protein [Chloroflexi bacterium]|nr:glycosyltransferase family 2 protein [Chloroflexota bacterium]
MLVIIIVNWNVRELLRRCLQSLERYRATTHPQQIVVVDNASSDGSVEMLRRQFPDVHVVVNQTNRGFTGGNNDGIQAAEPLFHAQAAGTSYVLLLNPDTEVTEGALDALLAYADAHPETGLVGPQLLYPDGSVQSSRRRFPTLSTALFESTWLQPFAPPALMDRFYMRDQPDDQVCDVDWLYGAAMLVRRSAYQLCGLLDAQTFFMYSEEVDWCKRIKTAWRIVYVPQARIIHHEGKSSEQASARRMIHFNTSKVRYFRKHHGQEQAFILQIALLSMFAYQFVLEGTKWLFGHRRELRAQRMRAYRDVLRSRLQ